MNKLYCNFLGIYQYLLPRFVDQITKLLVATGPLAYNISMLILWKLEEEMDSKCPFHYCLLSYHQLLQRSLNGF